MTATIPMSPPRSAEDIRRLTDRLANHIDELCEDFRRATGFTASAAGQAAGPDRRARVESALGAAIENANRALHAAGEAVDAIPEVARSAGLSRDTEW